MSTFGASDCERTMHMVIRTVSCLAAIACAASAAAQPIAVSRSDVRVSDGPRAVVAADFDRNGRLDLATANLGAASVSIVLNLGDGHYSHAYDFRVGAGPFDLVAAELNGDGVMDLAVANADANSVSILLGRGVGGFTVLPPLSTGASPRGLAAGDFDRDGRIDLMVSAWGANRIELYRGDGAGAFVFGGATVTGINPQGMAAGDVNRDGRLDLVVAHNGAPTAVFFGDGRGVFTLHELLGGAATGRVVALADFNRDSFLDLAAVSMKGTVAIYSFNQWSWPDGHSEWTFAHVRNLTTTGAQDARGLAVLDINADGRLDLATANRGSDNLTVYTGQPSNWFGAGTNVRAADGARAITAADFDHDGRPDLATGNEFGDSVSVLHNRTDVPASGVSFTPSRALSSDPAQVHAGFLCLGTFTPGGSESFAMYVREDSRISVNARLAGDGDSRRTTNGPPGTRGCAIADFNRDGWNDYAVLSMDNRAIYVYPGAEDLGIGDRTALATPAGGRPNALAVGEFNGDGIPDLAVTADNQPDGWRGITIFLGSDDFTFQAAGKQPLLEAYEHVTIGDFNRDGRSDVIAADAWIDDIVFLAGDGRGGLQPPASLPWGGGPTDLASADFNEDGILDVVVIDDYTHARLMLGNGDGTFQNFTEHPTHDISSNFWMMTVADMNRDGHVDVVTPSSILYGDGDGGFSSLIELDSGDFAPRVADVNQDGLPDLVMTKLFDDGVGLAIRLNTSMDNRAPQADAGPDLSTPANGLVRLNGSNSRDPDSHALLYEWRNERGEVVGDWYELLVRRGDPGTYTYTLTVRDQFGASSTDSTLLTVRTDSAFREIVMFATHLSSRAGSWQYVPDTSAAGGRRMYHPNAGAAKAAAPVANPTHYIELTFHAEAGYPYHLWIRGKADQNNWANDSVFVQFDGTVTGVGGGPAYRIGTTSGLAWNLEECSACGLSGWGWEDTGWGAVNQIGPDIFFATTGTQRMRIQAREDGVSLDQIVLSAGDYFRARPGSAKNDTTILTRKP